MKKYDIFPVSVFIKKANRHNDIKKYIDENIMPSYNEYNGNSNTAACNVYSDYFSGAPRLDQEMCNRLYQEDINDFLQFVQFNPTIRWNINSVYWYSITGKGGWQEMHDHISAPRITNFSAVHYVKIDPEHAPVRFINPKEQIIRATLPSEDSNENPFMFRDVWALPPVEEGDIIFFPSYLKHDVPIQTSEKTRISIAMNLGITKE